ncbi:MAG: hypothetical protein GWN12_13555, partial [Thermoplasmata archaeon]|nr:hypothetical protein [Thermoplasmata archaeon]NIS13048.1 hypothetical protein [Thermoplasmata archaeon]NIS20953.1 hypothetical protein [Thermoplasmata archaeon]NIT75954.1 hypothetical protein [Thermoplasmata archaeon]NIW89765.1 hypothetical protein [Thermoplasmata archaeon]
AGITVIGNEFMEAQIDFVEVHDTFMADAFYFENIHVDMSNCDIYDIDGSAIQFSGIDNTFEAYYNLSIIDTNIYNCSEDGIAVWGDDHYGIFMIDVYNVDIWNISEDALWMLIGESGGNNANGSLFGTFDQMNIRDIGDMAVYMSTLYTRAGDSNWSNWFNCTFTNMTFENIKNTGMYVQLVYSTVYYHLVVDNSEFRNISLEPTFQRIGAIWWWFQGGGGETSMYVANTLFKNCNPQAFEVWDYGGNDFHFYNCEFTGMTQAGAYLGVKSSASQSPTVFEECSFHDADAKAVNSYFDYRGKGTPVMILNCTVWNLTDIAFAADGSSYTAGYGFNISGSDIHDIGDLAVDVYGYYNEGSLTLHIVNTTIARTTGVRIQLGQDSYQSGASLNVIVHNTSITESRGTALTVSGNTYYNPCRLYFQILNSTIDGALGDGINVKTEISGTSSYYKPRWDSSVFIINVTVNEVNGIGIALQAGSSTLPGTREFAMNETTIYGAQRGLFNVGYNGDLYYCDIQNTLKEDIFAIDARLDLFYCSFTNINE